jgi:hypothetical protein
MGLIKVASNRVVICDVCQKEIELRWGIFGHDTLNRHMKEHNG